MFFGVCYTYLTNWLELAYNSVQDYIRMENYIDMTEKKSTYNYEAQKKYNEKNVVISLKFIHSEKSFLDSIEKACHNTGMSRQKYIKDAIMEKLKRDGYMPDGEQ